MKTDFKIKKDIAKKRAWECEFNPSRKINFFISGSYHFGTYKTHCADIEFSNLAHLHIGNEWVFAKKHTTTYLYNKYEKIFNEYSSKWKRQTSALSNLLHITRNENYLSVIGMGNDAVPFILKDLQQEPYFWFDALRAITKENPVPDEDFGDVEKMAAHWLKWGESKNLI